MKKFVHIMTATALLAGTAASAHAADGRDYISIVGSSTVSPFATVVAEQFGKSSKFKTPKIEITGTGGGMKLFCAGDGVDTPDIANASRQISKSEVATCAQNGVSQIVEIKIGYDGIVLANSKKAEHLQLGRKDLFLALAKEVPSPAGGDQLVANPYKTWHDVNPKLPAEKIEVLGPSPVSGTRDAFVELIMDHGCSAFPSIKALQSTDEKKFKAVCQSLREDGAYVEVVENYNLIVQKLEANPKSLGIFGFSYLDQNADKIQASTIEGVQPEFKSIADGTYPVSRPLFIYVKKDHVGKIPGIAEFLAELTSDRAWGEQGYLADKGLIPMPRDEQKAMAANAKALNVYLNK
ncbi:MAG: PstS family phosphate ABC transporter substrate-binding protein [Desulfobulbus sp.]|nr:PstS family phosphate ABC transporter substrate-binding protein [Desulfobulbus sp.]